MIKLTGPLIGTLLLGLLLDCSSAGMIIKERRRATRSRDLSRATASQRSAELPPSFRESADRALRSPAEGWSEATAALSTPDSIAQPITPTSHAQPGTVPVQYSPAQHCVPCLPPSSPTRAMVAGYGWLPAMDGTITINNNELPIDVSLSDSLQAMKHNLRGAAMMHVEVAKDDWGIIVDGMLISMGGSQTRGPLAVSAQIDTTFLECVSFYRIFQSTGNETPWHIDVLGGARYYDIDLDGQVILGGVQTFNRGQSNNWIDLVVGARSAVDLTESLQVYGRADIGGFGIGTSSDSAWNVAAGMKYKVAAIEGLSLVGGYRYFAIDAAHSSGSPDAFGFDVRMHGPFSAFVYEF